MAELRYTTVDGSAILLVDLSSVYVILIYMFLPSRLQSHSHSSFRSTFGTVSPVKAHHQDVSETQLSKGLAIVKCMVQAS